MSATASDPAKAQPARPVGPAFADIVVADRTQRLEYAWIDPMRTDAPLFVFLHEGLGSLAMWKDFPSALCAAAGARGLVFSRYGYGRSTPRPTAEKWPVGYMHDQAMQVLPALFGRLGLHAPLWLFGHSDGASIALIHAAAFPDLVCGVVAVSPHVFVEDVGVASIEQARIAFAKTDLRQRLARYHDDPDSAFFGWNDIWLDPAFRSWNIEDCLPRIRCPVLAVQGEDDKYGTMAQVEAIARHTPRSRLVKLAACGHSPHRDRPDALIAAAASFLRAQEAGTPAAEARA